MVSSSPDHTGRPQPVTGSHPGALGNPSRQEVLLLPTVTSWTATPGLVVATLQRRGARKPSGRSPATSRMLER